MSRFANKRPPIIGRVAAITAANFNADDFGKAARPLEQRGFSISVVSNTTGVVSGQTETGQDVSFIPISTIGDMDFDGYCALVLPGNSHEISDSTHAAIEKFLSDSKPIIATSGDVPMFAKLANAPDVSDASVVISLNGKVFAARGEQESEEAIELFAQALAN